MCVPCCVCAFGNVVCAVEVDVVAGGGSWSGEDVLEALEDLFLSECGPRFVTRSERWYLLYFPCVEVGEGSDSNENIN